MSNIIFAKLLFQKNIYCFKMLLDCLTSFSHSVLLIGSAILRYLSVSLSNHFIWYQKQKTLVFHDLFVGEQCDRLV